MKRIFKLLIYFYNIFKNTCGEFNLFPNTKSTKHRTKHNPIELYRVNKSMSSSIKKNYREFKINRTLYRITDLFAGEVNLKNTLEDLIVKKVLKETGEYKK